MPWTKLLAEQSAMETEQLNIFGMGDRVLSYQQAIKEAICQSMEIDRNVIVLGEGIDAAGYIYDTTNGLSDRFGQDRIIETPIAEAAMTGVTLGAALAGKRPILMHMRNDFLLVSMDQIVNHIAHWQEIFGDNVPLVIRAIIARGWGSGAQHSQSFQRLFAGFEGLDVIMPATPYDVKGMFFSAISSNRPVIFLEHRWLYGDKGFVPERPYTVPIGKAAIRKEGKDITVVGMSLSNRDIEKAVCELENEGIQVEWIDIRSIQPTDFDSIYASVNKTGRLLIVENGSVNFGVGSEIAAKVAENCFNSLISSIKRIGWKKTTIPAGAKLEDSVYPKIDEIKEEIKLVVKNNV